MKQAWYGSRRRERRSVGVKNVSLPRMRSAAQAHIFRLPLCIIFTLPGGDRIAALSSLL